MSAVKAHAISAAPVTAASDAEERDDAARVPLCFVVDGDASIRHFLSLVLHGVGIDTEEFADGHAFRAAVSRCPPDLVFLNIALESADSIECVAALSKKAYGGYVQLMSSRGSAVLEHVKSIGQQQRLQMFAVLKKPFETSAVLQILQDLKLGHPPALASRIDLADALRNDLDRVLVPAEDRSTQKAVGRRRNVRARAASARRRAHAGRVHPWRHRVEPDHAFRAGADAGA